MPVSHDDAYDEVSYPNFAFPQTHPDRLASLATLFGMSPAPVERCRVLELGCGNGGNLIPMAFTLPASQFVGIDRASQPISKGKTTIAALGLTNIELLQLDLSDVDSKLGQFDYIVAHGLYSWVPAEVQERMLVICRSCLAPQGVVYLSYNTYPGCHLRTITREMMLFHTKEAKDTRERIAQARALISWLVDLQPGANAYQMFLQESHKHFNEKSDAAIYHDDLAGINSPVYFHEFIKRAAQHGLKFLSEAEYFDVQYSQFPAPVSKQLSLLGAQDVLAKEQYIDFLEGRSFRQTLLCHHEITLERNVAPARVKHFYLRADVRPVSADPDICSEAVEEFQGKKESAIATSLPMGKAALLYLGEIYPRSIRFDELVAEARQRILKTTRGGSAIPTATIAAQETQVPEADGPEALADLLLRAHGAGMVEVHLFVPKFTLEPGHRPLANPLARLQAVDGPIITTLLHNNIKLEDYLGRQLLLLLDGTRDRTALLQELRLLIESEFLTASSDAEVSGEKEKLLQGLPQQLEENLSLLAKLGLLLA
jgi:methyltransferase-like protein/cyclopropane fatty-acyl-phospholipid synthase-like methyltransferase